MINGNGQAKQRSKYWVFTVNNYTDDTYYELQGLYFSGTIGYLCIGFEVGENGTPHLQGYVEFSTRVTRTFVSARIPRAFVAVRRGTTEEAITYCKKEGEFYEEGSPQGTSPGARTDLAKIRDDIKAGTSNRDIAESHFSKWVIYRRSFEAYRDLLKQPRDWITEVYVFVGKTGTGKSRVARRAGANDLWVSWDSQCKWFDGYNGQSNVLFDDFTGEGCNIGQFLQLLDRYSCTVAVKGGSANWNPRRIMFTSNKYPDEWFPSASPEQYEAFKRRISKLWRVDIPIVFTDDGLPSGGNPSFKETLRLSDLSL